jgi:hypothetical protein
MDELFQGDIEFLCGGWLALAVVANHIFYFAGDIGFYIAL